jgi:hypothetical protein
MRIARTLVAGCSLFLAAVHAPGQAGAMRPAEGSQPTAEACAKLSSLPIPDAAITSAQAYGAGALPATVRGPFGENLADLFSKLPAFCRVVAAAKPTSDSNITVELWMPLAGWNGRFEGIGNGGFAGSIDTSGLAALMAKGYAVAATDTGHSASFIDASWAPGHPEKVIDFGYRGIHEMTRVAKAVVEAFYGSSARHSYFSGCSDGGREALMEAQRYPEDYDGILAGAPANYWTRLVTIGVTDTQALTMKPESYIPPKKIPAIAHAVLAACDQLDGVRDGILNDPRQCKFDPVSVACKNGEDTDQCLTAPQVTALRTIYAGLQDEHGHNLFPGYLPGAEDGFAGWAIWILGPAPGKSLMAGFGGGFYANMVYEKPDWDLKSFNLETGLALAQEKTAVALNAIDPNLKPFRSHGGKLILYHGWDDPAIPSLNTVDYYEDVVHTLGAAKIDSFVRLYMVPGMQHCFGGPGPDNFGQSPTWNSDPKYNVRTALEEWVEKGTAPGAIITTKAGGAGRPGGGSGPSGPPVMTRPLCPFPQVAQYKGAGDTNAAENFMCSTEKK